MAASGGDAVEEEASGDEKTPDTTADAHQQQNGQEASADEVLAEGASDEASDEGPHPATESADDEKPAAAQRSDPGGSLRARRLLQGAGRSIKLVVGILRQARGLCFLMDFMRPGSCAFPVAKLNLPSRLAAVGLRILRCSVSHPESGGP